MVKQQQWLLVVVNQHGLPTILGSEDSIKIRQQLWCLVAGMGHQLLGEMLQQWGYSQLLGLEAVVPTLYTPENEHVS